MDLTSLLQRLDELFMLLVTPFLPRCQATAGDGVSDTQWTYPNYRNRPLFRSQLVHRKPSITFADRVDLPRGPCLDRLTGPHSVSDVKVGRPFAQLGANGLGRQMTIEDGCSCEADEQRMRLCSRSQPHMLCQMCCAVQKISPSWWTLSQFSFPSRLWPIASSSVRRKRP